MVTIVSYAIGKVYRRELTYMANSVFVTNPKVNLILGEGNPGSDMIEFYYFSKCRQFGSESITIPIKSENLEGWNRLGFIKPWFILKCIHKMRSKIGDELILWVDADAKVRRSVDCIERELTAPLGLSQSIYDGAWNAGTIALRDYHEVVAWLRKWWDRCKPYFDYDHKGEWKWNDQTVMRALIDEGDDPGICVLEKKWCNIIPHLRGSKENPPIVRPDMDDAIIWHWLASRGQIYGWNWPPPESIRPK